MTVDSMPASDAELREQAIRQLKKRRDFKIHLLIYIMVNAFLTVVWFASNASFYWPIFCVVGWGIGIVANAWDAYSNDVPTESQISHQMDRMRRR